MVNKTIIPVCALDNGILMSNVFWALVDAMQEGWEYKDWLPFGQLNSTGGEVGGLLILERGGSIVAPLSAANVNI